MKRRFALLRGLFAFVLATTAVVHALHAIRADSGSPARHAVFVAINCVGAALLLVHPGAAFVFMAVLTLQQFQSHGSSLLESLRAHAAGKGPIDWTSALVLAFFPLVLVCLGLELKKRPR